MKAGKAFSLCTVFLSALCCCSLGFAGEEAAGKPVSYYSAVRPILVKSCQGCHQPAKASGKIVLIDYGQLIKAVHDDEKVVIPGKPEESLLYKEIIPHGEKPPSMPKKGEPLSNAEVGVVKRWILEGAKDDTPEGVKDNISPENPPQYQGLPVITGLDFSSDGKYLAVSGYHEVLLHKADGSGLEARLVGVAQRIQALSFSPDGKRLAVAAGPALPFQDFRAPGRDGTRLEGFEDDVFVPRARQLAGGNVDPHQADARRDAERNRGFVLQRRRHEVAEHRRGDAGAQSRSVGGQRLVRRKPAGPCRDAGPAMGG